MLEVVERGTVHGQNKSAEGNSSIPIALFSLGESVNLEYSWCFLDVSWDFTLAKLCQVLFLISLCFHVPGNLCAHRDCAEVLVQLGLREVLAGIATLCKADGTAHKYVARIQQKLQQQVQRQHSS